MSLRSALEQIQPDRATLYAARETLQFLWSREGEWFTPAAVERLVHVAPAVIDDLLRVLAQSAVLDSDGDPPKYRYHHDRLLDVEIARFLNRAERTAGVLRSNVERFRDSYGSK